jgi:tetratricopeptide (TPR) repeat protein
MAVAYVKKYKEIPQTDDYEAYNIEREHIGHQLFLLIKKFRSQLQQIRRIRASIRQYPALANRLDLLFQQQSHYLQVNILEAIEKIELLLIDFKEQEFVETLAKYWFLSEVAQWLFLNEFSYEKHFYKRYLLSIFNDFYFSVACLFQKKDKIDQYIEFAKMEIGFYPDKFHILKQLVLELLKMERIEEAEELLSRLPNLDREMINYLYYRIYLKQGNSDKAFFHLKREIDIYGHQYNLIPELIKLKKMSAAQIEHYIQMVLKSAENAIDLFFTIGRAFYAIGDYDQALHYFIKELELFPENNPARVQKLNLQLLQNKLEPSVLPELDLLKSQNMGILSLKAKIYYALKDYESCWQWFKKIILFCRNKEFAESVLYLFSVLNYIPVSQDNCEELAELKNTCQIESFQREIEVFLSFIKIKQPEISLTLEFADINYEVYLSGYSTAGLAAGYFFHQAKCYGMEKKYDQMLALLQIILKYNPGQAQIFEFLDQQLGSMTLL